MRKLWWLLPVSSLMVGCGIFHDRAQDYEVAQAMPRLVVPEELNANPLQDLLVVPEIGTAATRSNRDFKVPRPEFFYAEAGNEKVNLRRSEAGKLIMVEEPLASVWQEVEAFWAFNGIAVAESDHTAGAMETDWITDENSRPGFFDKLLGTLTFSDVEGPFRDKLRITLAAADGDQRTSIRLQHLRAPEQQQQVDWRAEGEDVGYKSEIMYDLLHFLSKATERSTARALAERSVDDSRAYLGRDSRGRPVLKLTSAVDHSWARIGEALQTAAIDVGSSNRELGKYYITYTTTLPVESPLRISGIGSFFDWLHGNREDITISTSKVGSALGLGREAEEVKYSSKQVQPKTDQEALQESQGYKIWLGDKVIYVFGSDRAQVQRSVDAEDGTVTYSGRYQVQLVRRSSGVFITILDEHEADAPAGVAEDLLWKLKEHLPAG